jgi:hypothetical protein
LIRKTVAGSILAAGLLVLGVSAPAHAAAQPKTATYTIQSTTETPVNVGKVGPGHSLTVTATGSVVFYPGCQLVTDGVATPADYLCTTVPDGPGPQANVYGTTCTACLGYAPLGALIGRLGTNGSWFLVGSSKTISSPRSENLYLAYNDFSGSWINGVWVTSDVQYLDNVGTYTAVVTRN